MFTTRGPRKPDLALKIISVLKQNPNGIWIRKLARLVDEPTSTVYKYVTTYSDGYPGEKILVLKKHSAEMGGHIFIRHRRKREKIRVFFKRAGRIIVRKEKNVKKGLIWRGLFFWLKGNVNMIYFFLGAKKNKLLFINCESAKKKIVEKPAFLYYFISCKKKAQNK